MNECGVLYVATGDRYIEEVLTSARSVKHHTDDIHITLVTDGPVDSELLDNIVISEELRGSRGEAHYYFDESPYQKTLYLDTDTVVSGDITDLFSILERFDIAVAHAPSRRVDLNGRYPYDDIPDCFPEYNRGVVAYKKNGAFQKFLNRYHELYESHMTDESISIRNHDQPAMRKALYQSDLRIATLPPEYNCRGTGYAEEDVKILHQRYDDMKKVIAELNSIEGPRIYHSSKGGVTLISPEKSVYTKFFQSIKDDGVVPTMKKALGKLK